MITVIIVGILLTLGLAFMFSYDFYEYCKYVVDADAHKERDKNRGNDNAD